MTRTAQPSVAGRITPEWCLNMAKLEEGHEVGAGVAGLDPTSDCPHAAPHRYCEVCKVSPCPIGLGDAQPSVATEGEVERLRLAIGNAGRETFVNSLGYCVMRGMLAVDPETTQEQADDLLREAALAAIAAQVPK